MTAERPSRVTPEFLAILKAERDILTEQYPTLLRARQLALNLAESKFNYWQAARKNNPEQLPGSSADFQAGVFGDAVELAHEGDWSEIKRILDLQVLNIEMSDILPTVETEELRMRYKQIARII